MSNPNFDNVFSGFSPESIRTAAMSAGDLGATVTQEVRRILEKTGSDQNAAVASGISQLAERGLISKHEAQLLSKACESYFNALKGEADAASSFIAIRQLYKDMIADENSSLTAIAIGSILNSAFTITPSRDSTTDRGPESSAVTASVRITPESTGAGAVAGGVIGGVIGGMVGGPIGAGIGAVIGGAAGAAIGLCNEAGV